MASCEIQSQRVVELDDLQREYHVYLPETACAEVHTVVFWLHCWGCSFDSTKLLSDFTEDFIFIRPTGFEKSWNTPDCCGTAQERELHDVCLLQMILLDLARANVKIEWSRIYLAGFSNGGFLSSYATLSNVPWVRGFISISGHVYDFPQKLEPSATRPVFIHHSEDDTCVKMNGCCRSDSCKCTVAPNRDVCIATESIFDFWLRQNQCTGKQISLDQFNVRFCETGIGCKANTTFCKYFGVTHHLWTKVHDELGEEISNWIRVDADNDHPSINDPFNYLDYSICPHGTFSRESIGVHFDKYSDENSNETSSHPIFTIALIFISLSCCIVSLLVCCRRKPPRKYSELAIEDECEIELGEIEEDYYISAKLGDGI